MVLAAGAPGSFRKYRYVGGMIAAALIWPFMLLQLAVIGIAFFNRLVIGQPASVVPAQTMIGGIY